MNIDIKNALEKYKTLQKNLQQMPGLAIAFSGGVDSTFLLKAAADVLKGKVVAITAVSATLSGADHQDARDLAASLGVRHIMARTHELDHPDFIKNPENKCYVCKKIRFEALGQIASEQGITCLAHGENMDDLKDFRPGSLAARELGVKSPLQEALLTKDEIRFLSKELGLPTWNKPSGACLASRIPYHQVITPQKLDQIDQAEKFIRSLGIVSQVRVRHEGDTARIEVDDDGIEKLAQTDTRIQVTGAIKALGFKFVSLDLEGYAMGSLNRSITETT